MFHTEPEEATDRIKQCIDNLHYWKELFFKYKEDVKGMFEEGQEVEAWDFPPSLIFSRFDGFTERIEVVLVSLRSLIKDLSKFLLRYSVIFVTFTLAMSKGLAIGY